MVKRNLNDDCAPAQYRIKQKKPTRSRSNGVFISKTKEIKVFGIIWKSTTLLIGQGTKMIDSRKRRKGRILLDICLAITLAFLCAVGIEITKMFFSGILP